MSLTLVEAEIRRFLASEEPEVLCIKGKWGVGKTFAWRKYLADAEALKASAFDRYSYVSLFGLNSLDDLRYAIVEGSVLLAQAAEGPTLETLTAFLKEKQAKAQPIVNTALAYFGKKDLGAAVAKAAFLAIRGQLICFDDLERAGDGLDVRDILGLASMLKEQRGCKIVLLSNRQKMQRRHKKEFKRQLEKVVDVSLTFSPDPREAAAIAVSGQDHVSTLIRERVSKLGIVNIRVIKKIERLAKRVCNDMKDNSEIVRDQAVTAVALGGWSVLQPGSAPGLKYLKTLNTIAMRMRRRDEGGQNDELSRWEAYLKDFPFILADDLDNLIFDGVERGYFDQAALKAAADELDAKAKADARNSTFSKAWEAYHGSLVLDDDQVLDGLFKGAMENLTTISVPDANATIMLLSENGREDQAATLLQSYIAAADQKRSFFDLRNQPFLAADEVDPTLRAAFKAKLETFIDQRDPREVVISLSDLNGYNSDDVKLFSSLDSQAIVKLLETIQGLPLLDAIRVLRMLAGDATDEGQKLQVNLHAALVQIARRSPLRARRMKQFGISLEDDVATADSGTAMA